MVRINGLFHLLINVVLLSKGKGGYPWGSTPTMYTTMYYNTYGLYRAI